MVEVAEPQKPAALVAEAEALGARLARVREAIGRVIFGQEQVVERTLITLLSGGHVLLVGVPGLGKTKLVETLGTVLGLDAKRVQFTPDLMPADILGSEVLEEDAHGKRAFRFIQGPIFCQLLMADEINRACPAHPIGAAAGDAGAPGGDRRRDPPAARALPRAGHAEPDRAGRHLPPARSAARPLPAGNRRRLPRPRGRARHAAGHHRRVGGEAGAGHDRRRADRRAGADPPHAGRRERARRHPDAGARRPARDHRARRMCAATSPGAPARAPRRR